MGKIRVNDLARELEVKSKTLLEYLLELGVQDKKSHSSALEDDLTEKVRQHFRALGEKPPAEEVPVVSKAATPLTKRPGTAAVHPSLAGEAKKAEEARPEVRSMTRSIAEIKAEARRAVSPPAPLRSTPTAERPIAKAGTTLTPARPAAVPGSTIPHRA